MSVASAATQEPQRIEDATIQPIPDGERHGKARDLFTIWFGSNIMVLTIVTGALATSVFGQSFWSALVAIMIGNLVGAVFMALHSAQGPRLGVPQMVQTRGQFGSYGSLLVVVIVIIMYVGFFASNLVLGGQSLSTMSPHISTDTGIVIVGVVSVTATIFGYDLIHAYTRVMTYFSGAVLLLTFVWMAFVHHLPGDFFATGHFSAAGFMGTISTAALWQIAYAPYVSDYSRYMPRRTGARPAFWASYTGCAIGSILPMLLGAMIGLAVGGENVIEGLTKMTSGISVLVVVVFSIGIAATNAMNLYCGSLSTLTVGQTLAPRWSPRARSRAVIAVLLFGVALILALVGQSNFLVNYENFIDLLLYVLVPWTAVNLVDYYLVQHADYDVDDFFRADGGRYGRVNWVAIAAYVLGICVQVPFIVTTLYTGPVGKALDGVDLSWIVGLAVVTPFYYFGAKWFRSARSGAADQAATDQAATELA
ncbi:MAG TPA: cytosine permease [Trebonia sp.]|jgi:NCS1 family nucleobase:cation symporter-1|nr:cytosine permease [Trebonia sp.]